MKSNSVRIRLGDRFGFLTVNEFFVGNGRSKVVAVCDCGNKKTFIRSDVKSAKSCGCARNPRAEGHNVTHGLSKTKEYKSWHSMKSRCRNPSSRSYKYYAGRGITMCDRWNDYSNFLVDMGPRPPGTTLERTDVNLGYTPDNCVWATWDQQARNRRNNVFVMLDGERIVISDACRRLGIKGRGISWRAAQQGVSPQDMIDRYVSKRNASLGRVHSPVAVETILRQIDEMRQTAERGGISRLQMIATRPDSSVFMTRNTDESFSGDRHDPASDDTYRWRNAFYRAA